MAWRVSRTSLAAEALIGCFFLTALGAINGVASRMFVFSTFSDMALAPGCEKQKSPESFPGLEGLAKRWSVRLRKYLQPWPSPGKGKGKVKCVVQTAQPFHVLSPCTSS